jgi:hypothetical protein
MNNTMLSRFTSSSPEPEDDGVYKAFTTGGQGRGETRLKLVHGNGMVTLMTYAYLVEVVSASHESISLVYTNCVIVLMGRNLMELIDLIQDEKLRALHCFNAKKYERPPVDAPVILEIKRLTLKEAFGE